MLPSIWYLCHDDCVRGLIHAPPGFAQPTSELSGVSVRKLLDLGSLGLLGLHVRAIAGEVLLLGFSSILEDLLFPFGRHSV